MDFLKIQEMKRRAVRLRRLIDSNENKERKAQMLREYAHLIWLICTRSKT
jgi:hypothetical protein